MMGLTSSAVGAISGWPYVMMTEPTGREWFG